MSKTDCRKVCEGCKFYEQIFLSTGKKEPLCRIRYPIISSTYQCPCLTCLVKMMCSHTCKEFFRYRDYILSKEVFYEEQ